MHVRFSTCVGLPIVAEEQHEAIGTLQGIFLHPDTAAVEGVFVRVDGFLQSSTLFLAAAEIARWGKRITVRHADALCPLDEHVRLTALQEERRPILSQVVRTEEGAKLGRCTDVQLSTTMLRCEWIFCRRWWGRETAIPVTDIVEVRREAIIVRPPLRGVPVVAKELVAAPPTFA